MDRFFYTQVVTNCRIRDEKFVSGSGKKRPRISNTGPRQKIVKKWNITRTAHCADTHFLTTFYWQY
jgi:hypothetical protein